MKKCLMCSEKIKLSYNNVFCSKDCYELAREEAADIDLRIEFLFGKKTLYCKNKLKRIINGTQ